MSILRIGGRSVRRASSVLSMLLFAAAPGWAQHAAHDGGASDLRQPAWDNVAFVSDCGCDDSGYGEAGPYCDCSEPYCGVPHCGADAPCCPLGEPGCGMAEGCCDLGCCDPCVPAWAHRTGVWGKFLYLHPTDADIAHAQQQNGTGGAGTVPFGQIGVVDPDYEPGVRVGGQIACDWCSSVAVSCTFFESSAINSVDVPAGVGGGLGTVGSLVHHPATAITSSVGPVDATYDIKMQIADGEYRRLLAGSECGWINYSVGARYARLEQNFAQLGNFGGSSGGDIDTNTEIDFDGAGIKVGLDGERKMRGRWSGYGNASLSALVGEFRGDYRQFNETTVTDLAIVSWTDDRVVPMLEYEVGVAWTSCSGHCRAKFGYTAIHYFNTVTTPEFIDAVQANNYTDVGGELTFSGLTSTVEWRY